MSLISNDDGIYRFAVPKNDPVVIVPRERSYRIQVNQDKIWDISREDTREIHIEADAKMSYHKTPYFDFLRETFAALDIQQGVCVDIGAYDGVNYSHSFDLFMQGWRGLAVECSTNRFSRMAFLYQKLGQVELSRTAVTPHTVVPLLQAHGIPEHFDFLSLDIDSYDYYVLEALLQAFRPSVICTEINEVIPPPVRFAAKYTPQFQLDFSTRFYGMSFAMVQDLCARFGYHILKMNYMDLILIDANLTDGQPEDPLRLYQREFVEQEHPDYYADYPFDIEKLLQVAPEEALRMVRQGWKRYAGDFVAYLPSA